MDGAENREAPGLVVLWVSQDREAALHMALMYAKNARLQGWWDKVSLIVWGPSARLLSQDSELQAEVEECAAAGVRLQACKACADRYDVAPELARLGFEVIYIGQAMTDYLKDGWKILSV